MAPIPILTLCLLGSRHAQADLAALKTHLVPELAPFGSELEVLYLCEAGQNDLSAELAAASAGTACTPRPVRLNAGATEPTQLHTGMQAAQGVFFWLLPIEERLRPGQLSEVMLRLRSAQPPDVLFSRECLQRAALLELMGQKYLNGDDKGTLEALFSKYAVEDWLSFGRQIVKAARPWGFLSSLVLRRRACQVGLSQLKRGTSQAHVQNQLFFQILMQQLSQGQPFRYALLPQALFAEALESTPLLEDLLSDETTVVLKNFRATARNSVQLLDPFNYQAFLASDHWYTYLYPFTGLEIKGKQLADFLYNALASAQNPTQSAARGSSLAARESEIRALFAALPHAHLSHLLNRLFSPPPPTSIAKVHKAPPADAPRPKVSLILLDWECREFFQALHWLQHQNVPRTDYELIWVELYQRVTPEAMALADRVITCEQQGVYHKHQGYNEGLIRARGDLITVCDSDAVFPPDFIASILDAFEIAAEPEGKPLVLMHHEGRTQELYPEDKLRAHEDLTRSHWLSLWPNAGACMTVRRRDALFFGGFDEHESYRGYICGPYELGWRLVNAGIRQHWHESVFLWHFAHPHANQADNTSDWKEIVSQHIDHHAAAAVTAFSQGRLQPLQEHPEIFARRMQARHVGSKYERRYALYNPALLPADALPASSVNPQAAESPTPLVSAIVTTYKSERFMRSLLEDLERQTIADQLEIVIVDSASPENEGGIVAEFQQRYANIVYLRTDQRENSHVSLNHCLRLARGKYITLACTDDRHEPDAFERMAAALEARPDVALVYGDIAVTKNEADITGNRPLSETEIVAYYRWPEFHPVSFFAQCYAGPQPMWRRALHAKHGYFDSEFWSAGDYELWLRLVAAGEVFLHLPAVLGTMLMSASSNSNANLKLSRDEAQLCRERYWPRQWGKLPQASAAYLVLADPPAQQADPAAEPISILLRVEKHPELLAETLASILAQKHPHAELLILNASEQPLDSAQLQKLGLPYCVFDARGLAPEQARNLCLRMASGRYLFYLDSGDRWHPNHLQTHLKALQTERFVYSEALRLPLRRSLDTASYERLARDSSNSPDFNQASLLGHFIASCSLSHARSLLAELPLNAASLAGKPTLLARWRQIEAFRQAGIFAQQAQRFQDWDLQLLLAELAEPQRLKTVTCEYVEDSALMPAGHTAAGISARIAASARLLAEPLLPPAPPRLSLVLALHNQAARLEALIDDVLTPVPQDWTGEVILLDQLSQDATPELLGQLSGDIRTLRLGYIPEPAELLRKGLGLASGEAVSVVRAPRGFRNAQALPKGDGLWQLRGQAWEPVQTADDIVAAWDRLIALYGSQPSWQTLLEQLESANIQIDTAGVA